MKGEAPLTFQEYTTKLSPGDVEDSVACKGCLRVDRGGLISRRSISNFSRLISRSGELVLFSRTFGT